jgi:hypothetical protein
MKAPPQKKGEEQHWGEVDDRRGLVRGTGIQRLIPPPDIEVVTLDIPASAAS